MKKNIEIIVGLVVLGLCACNGTKTETAPRPDNLTSVSNTTVQAATNVSASEQSKIKHVPKKQENKRQEIEKKIQTVQESEVIVS